MSDYLTSLPSELLGHVCDYVPAADVSSLALVCRALVPFARTRRFKAINVYGSSNLTRLCKVIEASPRAAEHVERLEICFYQYSSQDDGSPTNRVVLKLLQRLTSLKTLAIRRSTRLIKALLADTRTKRLLPSLNRLVLQDPFDGWSTPLDPAHFQVLSQFPHLFKVEIDVMRKADTIAQRRAGRHDFEDFKSQWKWDVTLSGTIAEAGPFLLAVPEVRSLYLTDPETSSSLEVVNLLRYVEAQTPHGLTTLSVSCPLTDEAIEKLAGVLPVFHDLHILDFVHITFSASLLATISRLPSLTKLYVQSECTLSGSDAKSLLLGSHACATLSFLLLDHLGHTYEYGPRPDFDASFTEAEMEEIIDVADARQVELRGGAVRWTRAERRERIERAEAARAFEARRRAAEEEAAANGGRSSEEDESSKASEMGQES
ncbi:hypothetical protein JCM8097_005363 [Rhodosporidiobolus ruineniae]